MYEWDEDKSRKCLVERGFDFSIVADFDWETSVTLVDDRADYGETRYRSLGRIEGMLFSIVWTPRAGAIRIISVRRAHEKEGKRHGI